MQIFYHSIAEDNRQTVTLRLNSQGVALLLGMMTYFRTDTYPILAEIW